jgi:hypothetical protein
MFRLALFFIFCFSQVLTCYSQVQVQTPNTQINFYIVVCGNYGFLASANEKSIGEIFLMPSVVGNEYTDMESMACILRCDGSAIPVNKYLQLFSLIGTNYGGDGTTYFNIPYLQYYNGVLITSPPSSNQPVVVPSPPSTNQPVVVPSPPSTNQPVVVPSPPSTNQSVVVPSPPSTNPSVVVSSSSLFPIFKPVVAPINLPSNLTANPTTKPTANPTTAKPTVKTRTTNTLRK